MADAVFAARVDHVLEAVGDLDAATADFRDRLGMDAAFGGVHPGRGTHNSLVHFGSAYLELIGVTERNSERAHALTAFLRDGDGPYTFALAVEEIEVAARALRARGLSIGDVRDGSRRTPDGALLEWRTAELRPGPSGPGADAPPLPFLIEWRTGGADSSWFRSRREPAKHALAWGRVRAMLVATADPPATAREYETLFGWRPRSQASGTIVLTTTGGDRVNESLGPAPDVVLVSDTGVVTDASAAALAQAAKVRLRRGAGVLGLTLETPDLGRISAELSSRGVSTATSSDGQQAVLDTRATHGMVILVVQAA